MATAADMLQTGHADRLTWIKSTQMIPSPFFRETPASPLQCNKNAVRCFKVQFLTFAMREMSDTFFLLK